MMEFSVAFGYLKKTASQIVQQPLAVGFGLISDSHPRYPSTNNFRSAKSHMTVTQYPLVN